MKKIALFASLLMLVWAACKKADFDNTVTGEALGTFALSAPATNTSLTLNAATPDDKVVISWTASTPGIDAVPTYKWVAALKTGGSVDTPMLEIASDNSGKDVKLTLTQKQIDDVLKAKGIAAGAKTDLIWGVKADNGSTQLLSGETRTISITRMKDGATPFILLGPASSTTALTVNPVSTTDSIAFRWTRSTPATGGAAITYKVAFGTDSSFATILFSIPASNSGKDTVLKIAAKSLNDSLVKYGYADMSQTIKLKWTVIATSGTWDQKANYVNDIAFLRQVNFYIVGSLNGWSIDNPLLLIADQSSDRYGTVFYTYMKLDANTEFKFFKTKGDWGSGYGDDGAGTIAGSYNSGFNKGGNIKVTTAGIYRLSIDTKNNIAYVQQKQVGLVGSLQGWKPSTPLYGAYLQRDKFLFIAPTVANDEFKFHDGSNGPDWTWGVGQDRWWGDGGTTGKLSHESGAGNLKTTYTPYSRFIWDGTDPQSLKYSILQGKLRIVGSTAVVGSWTPANAPDMDYQGNGVWKKTITFTAATDFKFVSAEGFDFNYGADGATANIKENGDNISKPAGTYTITVDEYNRTYTIL